MTICLLKEGDAYQVLLLSTQYARLLGPMLQVMMKAHKEGVAVVGTYSFETAEAGCEP